MRIRDTLAQVLANPALRGLQASWLLGIAAEKAYLVALLVFAYDVGGVVAVGVFTMLASLPSGLFGPVLSSVAESFAPARALLGLHVGRALFVGAAALAVFGDLGVGIVLAAAIVEGILSRQHTATTRALLPALARTPEELVASNGVTSLVEGVGSLLGPIGAGVLLLVGGPALGLAVPAVAYLAAAAVVLAIHVPRTVRSLAEQVSVRTRLMDIVGGFRALGTYPNAGLLISLMLIQVVVRGALTVLLVSTAFELLGIGDAGVGYLNSAIGAGGLVGALLAMSVVAGRSLTRTFTTSLALWGAPIAVMGIVPNPIVAFAMAGVIGAANASIDVAGYTLLARALPNEARGRGFGVLHSLVGIGVAIGALAAPILTHAFGLELALVVSGLVLPVCALVSYRAVQRAEAEAIVPERELRIIRMFPMFAPLPLTALEDVARALEPIRFGAGERVISQGERGDCFYLIATGRVEVVHDGHRETTLGPGDGFGEIALLSDVPRTATIQVVNAMDGYRLTREPFLEAVTGNPSSVLAADELVSRRLAQLGH
ncbi:MAG TPA: MFS transporter [Candidatus Limnocylindria bacterium]|nr:MFS transporter [Candidatus Limnocylindria bacterium]